MNKILAVMGLLMFSLSASAASECKVDSFVTVFLASGRIYGDVEISDRKYVTAVDTWEECYDFAIQKANGFPTTLDLTLNGTITTTGQVYFSWEFDDGIFTSSNGKVTAYTPSQIQKPSKGDYRIRMNGSRFE